MYATVIEMTARLAAMARISLLAVVVGLRTLLVRGRLAGMTMNMLETGGKAAGILVLVRGLGGERCEDLRYVPPAPDYILS